MDTIMRYDQWTVVDAYVAARNTVIEAGYWSELEWMSCIRFESITGADILREGAWVILSSGMKESVVRKKFAHIAAELREWQDPCWISNNRQRCKDACMAFFRHPSKIDAILDLADYLASNGPCEFKRQLSDCGLSFLTRFSYLGPATSCHLAKNLGFRLAKPDRHLMRLVALIGAQDAQSLCSIISKAIGEPESVIDLVLWRFAAMGNSYADLFKDQRSAGEC
jgi:hypothetical protein